MDRWLRAGALCLGVALASACATATPPPPTSERPTVVAVEARHHFWAFLGTDANFAFFARMDDPESLPIPSNYRRGDYLYLLDAQPGTYALVAFTYEHPSDGSSSLEVASVPTYEAKKTKSGKVKWKQTSQPNFDERFPSRPSDGRPRDRIVYLPQTVVERTTVVVGEGDVAFMGEVSVRTTFDWKGQADATQYHYLELFAPGHRWKGHWHLDSGSGLHEVGLEHELNDDEAARREFLEDARDDFADTSWDGSFDPDLRTASQP